MTKCSEFYRSWKNMVIKNIAIHVWMINIRKLRTMAVDERWNIASTVIIMVDRNLAYGRYRKLRPLE